MLSIAKHIFLQKLHLRFFVQDTRNSVICSFQEFLPFVSELYYFSSLKTYRALHLA